MNIEPMEFVHSLKYMAQGMLGIFVVMGLIIAITVILNVISHAAAKRKAPDDDAKDA